MPTREIFFNVGLASILMLYAAMLVPAGFLAFGITRRIRAWRRGRPENRFEAPGRRLLDLLRLSVLHGRIVRRRNLYGGLMHLAIFSGFITLLVGTTLVAIEADIAGPLFGASFLRGNFYLGFKLAMNIAGLLLIAGVCMALYRRLVLKPATQQTSGDDLLMLAFLLALAVQGFALQGLRLAMTQDPWATWSFVSYPLALSLQDASPALVAGLHQAGWHAHFLTAFAFFGYVAYSKMMHPFTAMANVLFRRRKPRGELDSIGDIDQAETVGAARLEDFSWAQLMSLDACLHCGRCLEYCPTFNTGKSLRPRDLVLQLAGLQADHGGMFSGVLGEGANTGRFRHGRGADRELIGGAVSEEEIWDCTTCGACMEQCPVFIEPVPMIIGMRRNLVTERNSFPRELEPVFTSLERLGNPYQWVPSERAAWTAKLDKKVPEMAEVAAAGKSVEYLFFVGCMGSFSSRSQKTTIALARILQSAGIEFAILGKEERCHGDPARRMGHEFLAQQLAMHTVETLNLYQVKKVVTACPHCFNAIRNELPQLGGQYEVVHHSQLIAELLASGRLAPAVASALGHDKVTYHDPCYLGRHNGVYDEPREVIRACAGAGPDEMPRNRNHSFCCGGGGGRAMMKEQSGTRINLERVREALHTGAQVVAASCPFCIDMLEDGIGGMDATSKLRVLDIAEIAAASLQPSQGAGAQG
jgi:Fe-S oxidoreductase